MGLFKKIYNSYKRGIKKYQIILILTSEDNKNSTLEF